MRKLLTIAGSDPTGAAGIEQDLRVFQAFGCHGMAVASAHTVQDADSVHRVRPEDPAFFRERLDHLQRRYRPDVIKLGMLADARIVEELLGFLDAWKDAPRLVIDPVIESSSGHALLSPEGVALLVRELIPRADLLTPNGGEAVGLSKALGIEPSVDPVAAARALVRAGADVVCLTGGDRRGDEDELLARDYVWRRGQDDYLVLESPRSPGESPHGTGCAFASAAAASMSRNESTEDALRRAKSFITRAIAAAAHLSPDSDRRRVLVLQDPFQGEEE